MTGEPLARAGHHPAPPARHAAPGTAGRSGSASCRSPAAWCRPRPRRPRWQCSTPSWGASRWPPDIRAPWRGECRRCLRPLSGELHCEVRELYRPRDVDAVHGKGAVRHAAGGQHQRQAGPGGSAGQGGAEDHGRDGGQGAPEGHRRSGGHDGLWDHGGHGGNGGRRHGDQARWDADLDEDTYPLEGDQLDLRPLVRDALLLELPLAPLCREDCRGLCAECGADLNLGPCMPSRSGCTLARP